MIRQGEVYWVDLGGPSGSEPGYRHPGVEIQNNVFSPSRIGTVVVCMLTSNLKRAKSPGNVILDSGEVRLPKRSVVNVSQVYTVDKAHLARKIGTLAGRRVRQVLDGLRLVTEPSEP